MNVSAPFKWIIILIILYVLYCVLLFSLQRYMIYPGMALKGREPVAIPDTEVVSFSDGECRVEAWFMPSPRPIGAIIYGHGNYELIDDNWEHLLPYRDLGFHILLIEYPGYGRSTGLPSEKSITAFFIKGYDWLVREKHVHPHSIIAHGKSLGGGVVCTLSKNRPLRAMILESTFTGIYDMARNYLAPPFLLRDHYENLPRVREFRGPILLIHGTGDKVIPYGHSLALKSAAHDATLLSGTWGHSDFLYNARFWQTAQDFLRDKNIIPKKK